MIEAEIECKKICVFRCLVAVGLSIGIQYVLLGLFLLFVNFDILHPLTWISSTLGLVFSFYTWLCITPLISAVILYGIFLGNSHLAMKQYYPTRFSYIRGTLVRKSAAFLLHGAIGFFTAWLYSRFLDDSYQLMFVECFESYCLNSRYTFLALGGIYTGLYFFFKVRFREDKELVFPIIQEGKYVRIRSHLYSILYSSLLKSFIPTLCFSLLYWAFGWIVTDRLRSLFGVDNDKMLDSLYAILTSLRLLFYVWILSSQILSNMYLMDIFFSVLLSHQMEFAIEKSPVSNSSGEISLVEALSLSKVPIAQHLASLDLFNLSNEKNSKRRQQIYALSVPGGHPYNWNQLCGQYLSMINSFSEELAASMKRISAVQPDNIYSRLKPSATEAADKILLRQYNETYGIRNMMNRSCEPPQPANPGSAKKFQDAIEQFAKSCEDAARLAFRSIPGLLYLFGEKEESKTIYLLSQSQDIIWLTQAMSALCAASLIEDKYGVAQCELPNIIKSLLKLKLELDKVKSINLSGRRVDKNCNALRGAVKRSLYRICTVFADYMKDLIDDPEDLRILHCFVNYQEV